MAAYLEVWTPAGQQLVALEAGRLTLGTDPANDLPLPADPTLSRLHAALERYEAGCTTSSASTAAASGAGCGWPMRRCAAGR
jgi:hypothetical protein